MKRASFLWFCLYTHGLTTLPVVWRSSGDKLLSLFNLTLLHPKVLPEGLELVLVLLPAQPHEPALVTNDNFGVIPVFQGKYLQNALNQQQV